MSHQDGMLSLAARLNMVLPQTQCTRCGYPDCAGYAGAMAQDGVPINRCPPGGADGIGRLAEVMGTPVKHLDPAFGIEGPRSLAAIDENWCIGCTLCLDACPTDAIVGANKLMHTVVAEHCTGCELCLPVCPVDCISMENASGNTTGWAAWSPLQADRARTRYAAHTTRRNPEPQPEASSTEALPNRDKGAVIAAALARARARRG